MTRTERQKPVTEYNGRQKPTTHITKLQDNENVVCNENGEIIYVFADDGIVIVSTIWTARQK